MCLWNDPMDSGTSCQSLQLKFNPKGLHVRRKNGIPQVVLYIYAMACAGVWAQPSRQKTNMCKYFWLLSLKLLQINKRQKITNQSWL